MPDKAALLLYVAQLTDADIDIEARSVAYALTRAPELLRRDAMQTWVLRRAAFRAGTPTEPMDAHLLAALDRVLETPPHATGAVPLRRAAPLRIFEDLRAVVEGRANMDRRQERNRTPYDVGQAWMRSHHLLGRHADRHELGDELEILLDAFERNPRYSRGRLGFAGAVAWARIARSAPQLRS